MLFKCAATEADHIVDVADHNLVLESYENLVHEVAEICTCVAPSIRNAFPSEETERGDEGEVVTILGVDEHA